MYTFATSVQEAIAATGEFRAGGTDLQERLRSRNANGSLIDIFGVEGLDDITYADDGVTIGAMTTVSTVGDHPQLQRDYPALTLPAQTLATPQTRHVATMGGVLCQRTRCAYYRHPELGCPKKGNADVCPSRQGDHHLGVVFDIGPCVYPHPSSIGCALLTYDATVQINGAQTLSVADLFGSGKDARSDHTLKPGQMITAIQLPVATQHERASYVRQMSRAWAEWPLVEVVVRLIMDNNTIKDAKVAIGGVANIPLRLTEVEQALIGTEASEESLSRAAKVATERCTPLPDTEYKVPMVEASVLEALEQALANESGGQLEL